MGTRARVAVLLAALTLVGTVATTASADTSADQVRQAKQRAEQLSRQATGQAQSAAAAQNKLIALSAQANAALAQAEATARAVDLARQAADEADTQAQEAAAAAAQAREEVQDYSRNAYIERSGGGKLASLLATVNTGSPTDMLTGLAMLNHVGGSMSDALAALRAAEREQVDAATQAHIALVGLQKAEAEMRRARAAAQRAVGQQRALLADARARADAVAAQARQARATARELQQELQAEIAAARARAAEDAGLAKCEPGDISGYPNGEIPLRYLCALYGASAEELKRDAADRFNAMSRAYEQEFGSPICVADSYRSYERQQEIYRERPGYAAVPGTSEHGWARAVDLCGGIETDGTRQNTWMRINAAQFNWFHPGWADSGGGGPYEPWHWEYAG